MFRDTKVMTSKLNIRTHQAFQDQSESVPIEENEVNSALNSERSTAKLISSDRKVYDDQNTLPN